MSRSVRWVSVLVCLAGCGRYIPPVPPEMLAPKAVQNLTIVPSANGVTLSWIAPEQDRRGKELKSADGYSIERKEIVKRGDETDPSIRFTEVGFVRDLHIEKREELRREARAAGKVGRNIKSPAEFTSFTFTDSTPQSGMTYIYQIVPTNQGGVKGQVGQVIRIAFQGAQSSVLSTASKEIEDIAALSAPAQQ